MQRRKCLQGVQPCARFQRSSCAVLTRKRRRNVQSQHLHEKPSIQTTRKAQANRAHPLTSSGPVHDGSVPQSYRPAPQRRPRRPQQKACKPRFAARSMGCPNPRFPAPSTQSLTFWNAFSQPHQRWKTSYQRAIASSMGHWSHGRSWKGQQQLISGKRKATGHNLAVLTDQNGNTYVHQPAHAWEIPRSAHRR